MIHDAVLADICEKNKELSRVYTTVYYLDSNGEKNGKWGFCDLVNKTTGEVWELKKFSLARSCLTLIAKVQLSKYIDGIWKDETLPKAKEPYKTMIPSDSFIYNMGLHTYNVSYWDEGNGILRYTYTEELSPTGKTIVGGLIVGLLYGISFGSGIPIAPVLLPS